MWPIRRRVDENASREKAPGRLSSYWGFYLELHHRLEGAYEARSRSAYRKMASPPLYQTSFPR